MTAPAQTDPEIARIHALADGGRAPEAETQAREYVRKHPNSADAYFLLGYALFRQRKAKESLAEYTEGARYRRPSSSDLIAVGSNYVLLSDYPDADKWFTQALEWEPHNFLARYYLGRAKYNENRFEEAVSLFEQCLAVDGRNVKAKDNLGLSLQGLGRMEEAENAYRQAIAWQLGAEHRDPGPYLNLGTLLVDSDRAQEAIQHLQAAIAIDPGEVRTHRALGKAYLHLGRLEEAQSELETSVRMEPNQAATHFVLAQAYRRRGLLEKAKTENTLYMKLSGGGRLPESK